MSDKLSAEQLKKNEEALWSFLRTIEAPKKAAVPYLEDIQFQDSALEKLISRVKKLIQFLSKLNPMEYLAWMEKAFARATYSKPTDNPVINPINTETESPISNTQTLSPKRKRSFGILTSKKKSPRKG